MSHESKSGAFTYKIGIESCLSSLLFTEGKLLSLNASLNALMLPFCYKIITKLFPE